MMEEKLLHPSCQPECYARQPDALKPGQQLHGFTILGLVDPDEPLLYVAVDESGEFGLWEHYSPEALSELRARRHRLHSR